MLKSIVAAVGLVLIIAATPQGCAPESKSGGNGTRTETRLKERTAQNTKACEHPISRKRTVTDAYFVNEKTTSKGYTLYQFYVRYEYRGSDGATCMGEKIVQDENRKRLTARMGDCRTGVKYPCENKD